MIFPIRYLNQENMTKFTYPLVLIISLSLSACVYTLDIQQGNIINQEIVDQLRPQMTKRQVLYIMGSSMLTDVFHQKRWDYIYSEQLGGEERTQKRLSLFFEGDKLVSVQGDLRPSSMPVKRPSNETTVEIPKRDLEKTLWEKISGIFSSDEPELKNAETVLKTKSELQTK